MTTWHQQRFEPRPGRVAVACKECGRAMWLPPSKVSVYRSCSLECGRAEKARLVAARERPCETCSSPFTPRQAQLTRGCGRYCSQACNPTAKTVLQRPEIMDLAANSQREGFATGRLSRPTGPENKRWMGGPKASAARRQADGRAAAGLRRYRHANPEKVREFSKRRSDRKTGRLPRGTVKAKGEAQRWKCAICAASIKRGYHMDHIMPLKRGGIHEPRNIQLLCATCNVRKNARDPIDYMQSLGRLL